MTTYLDYTLELLAISLSLCLSLYLSLSLFVCLSLSETSWGRRRLLAWSKPVFKLKKGANVQRPAICEYSLSPPSLCPPLSLSLFLSFFPPFISLLGLSAFAASLHLIIVIYYFNIVLMRCWATCWRNVEFANCSTAWGEVWYAPQDVVPSPSHSLCVLLSLCRIIDRLQLEALSEIIIIRLNALAATVLQSCFLSITHALSGCLPLSLSLPSSCYLAHLTQLLLMAPSIDLLPTAFRHSALAPPTCRAHFNTVLSSALLNLAVVLSLHFNCIIKHNYSAHS